MTLLPRWLTALALALLISGQALAQKAAPVEVTTVGLATLSEELVLSGTVTALRRADLSPRVSGLVQRIAADTGDQVKAGQLLVELDPTLARLAMQRTGSALAEARTQLREARRLHKEATSLVDRKFLPGTRLDAAKAELDRARASVARREAEHRETSEIVARHRVNAPFGGVIVRRHAELGEWVDTGDAVLELVSTGALRIDVQMPQEHFPRIADDSPVTVRPDASDQLRLEGRIAARVPVSDPTDRTFLVRVLVDRHDGALAPGMSARVAFSLPVAGRGLTVPRDALMRRPDGSVDVWLARDGADGAASATRQAVRLGRSLANRVEIVAGLEPGQRVIVRGNERLREGQPVRVVGTP